MLALTSIGISRFSLCPRGRGGLLKGGEVRAGRPLARCVTASEQVALRIYQAWRVVLCPWASEGPMSRRCFQCAGVLGGEGALDGRRPARGECRAGGRRRRVV